jgi:predicted lipoprotein with Yx(FWY)xxD motif
MRYMIALVLVLSGCAITAPTVKTLDHGRYVIVANDRSSTLADNDAMKQASSYCAGSGKTSHPESVSDQASANFSRASIVFTCD